MPALVSGVRKVPLATDADTHRAVSGVLNRRVGRSGCIWSGMGWCHLRDHVLDYQQSYIPQRQCERFIVYPGIEEDAKRESATRSEPMRNHRHDPEIRECENDDCQRQYDLARQTAYGPLCPVCRAEKDAEGGQ